MPCRTDGYEEMEAAQRQKTTDQLTQDLCYLCGTLEEAGQLLRYASTRIMEWWEQHQKDDYARVRQDFNDILEDYYEECGEVMSVDLLTRGAIETAEEEHPVSNFHKNWFELVARSVWETWTATKATALSKAVRKEAKKHEEFQIKCIQKQPK